MEIKKLNDVVTKLNIKNKYAIEVIKKGISDIDFASIDENLFDAWFQSQINYLMSGRYKASLFLTAFKAEYQKGTFKKPEEPKHVDKIHPGELEDTESFEAHTAEWMELIYEIDGDYPSYGTKGYDKNMNLRGIFDGQGGFIYTDGTIGIDPRFQNRLKEEEREKKDWKEVATVEDFKTQYEELVNLKIDDEKVINLSREFVHELSIMRQNQSAGIRTGVNEDTDTNSDIGLILLTLCHLNHINLKMDGEYIYEPYLPGKKIQEEQL